VITFLLFQGCSGYTLQSLIDGESADRTAPQTTLSSEADGERVPPSQNSALQKISPSKTAGDDHEEHRIMQKETNAWIENEWEPLTEGNKEMNISAVVEDNSTFTLQHYVDKAALYKKNKTIRDANKTKVPSHVDKVNAMPVIGKKER